MKEQINLGDRVRDPVTGYDGIVTGISMYLYGCRHIGVQAQSLHEGDMKKMVWFDEPQLDIVDKAVIKAEPEVDDASAGQPAQLRRTGGPMLRAPQTPASRAKE